MHCKPFGLILASWQLYCQPHIPTAQRCFSELVEVFTLIGFMALERLERLVLIAAMKIEGLSLRNILTI